MINRRGFALRSSVEITPADLKKSPRVQPIVNLRRYFEERSSHGTSPVGERLEDEFNYIDKTIFRSAKIYEKEGRFETASREENKMKNRYSNILPFEKTRVKLMPIDDQPGSDYINASFIDGATLGIPYNYIATQAPTDFTVQDFWRMIWEQQSSTIVMLTSFREGAKEQCSAYFPTEQNTALHLGFFDVETLHVYNVEGIEGLTVRDLKLTVKIAEYQAAAHSWSQSQQQLHHPQLPHQQSASSPHHHLRMQTQHEGMLPPPVRIIRHIMYTAWQDFGVPTDTLGIRTLLKMLALDPSPSSNPSSVFQDANHSSPPHAGMNSNNNSNSNSNSSNHNGGLQHRVAGPLVVHCSAGVGRSGTFIAIHAVYAQFRLHRAGPERVMPFRFDVFNTLRYMRQCRIGMIQRSEQYEFVYQALLEASEADGIRFADGGQVYLPPSS
eukprot:ANDGO_06617.mRNA.1 Tyrosine-protein phosphatase Lar-like